MRSTLYSFILFCFLVSCNATKQTKEKIVSQNKLDKVHEMMTGTFSSEAQSIADTSYFSINLVMHPIWGSELNSRWLYVEQAATANMMKPYRQRVYQLSLLDDGTIASKVYELPDAAKFIHAWENEEVFSDITPASLITRQGCTVFLQAKDDCYSGSTYEKECLSSLRGSSYATSIVTICPSSVLSWDQGWNSEDEQVWGATKAAYVFDRK